MSSRARPADGVTWRRVALSLVLWAFGCDIHRVLIGTLCIPAPAGVSCRTTVDCATGLVCSPDSGTCANPPMMPQTTCDVCADGGPCCGACSSGQCQPPPSCGTAGSPCDDQTPCCIDQGCADAGTPGGVCAPSCGGYGAACTPDDGGDGTGCCVGRGLVCLSGGSCGFQVAVDSCSDLACLPVGAGVSCVLGAFCSGMACQDAGLTCGDFGSCRQPLPGEACQLGGPACQAPVGSTASLVCNGQTCVQLCLHNIDCNAIDEACDKSAGTCERQHQCSPPFSGCTLGANNDAFPGVCLADRSGTANGYCQQINDAVVVAGDPCDVHATRQNGVLCGSDTICVGGVCSPICNLGTLTLPTCTEMDAGCWPYPGAASTGDYITGFCSVDCDFTDPGGGGCGIQGKPPQKCLPDLDGGICVALVADAGTVGSACDPTASIDPCVAAASCFGPLTDGGGAEYRCLQLCRRGSNDACLPGSSCSGDGGAGHCL
jgi:hypothetical protein